MKFLQIINLNDYSGFITFEFSEHMAFGIGDQVWSNGHEVDIYDAADSDVIEELISMVENKQAFKGALRRLEII